MNKERLLNVAKALRESPAPDKFDMDMELHEYCGTPACAWGHYAARKDLQDVWVVKRRPTSKYFEVLFADSGHPADYCGESVIDHFGITWGDHTDLFDPGGCGGAETPIEAAEYIERFVARDGKP